MARHADLDRLYALLGELESRVGGMRRLSECTGYLDWPNRGVYFFFASDETRQNDDYPRITRIGANGVYSGSGASLWTRLRNHRGPQRGGYADGGKHRGSVFRERVGEALIARYGLEQDFPDWGDGDSAGRELRLAEQPLEERVSSYVRELPFLWIAVDDAPGPESDRKYIERNATALVSNYEKPSLDERAEDWLGKDHPRAEISQSGLWSIDHVEEAYDPAFLDRLASAIEDTTPP